MVKLIDSLTAILYLASLTELRTPWVGCLRPEGVVDAFACQQLLSSLGSAFGANTFMFTDDDVVFGHFCSRVH